MDEFTKMLPLGPLQLVGDAIDGGKTTQAFRAGTLLPSRALMEEYTHLVASEEVSWTVTYQIIRRLGSGGQGVVYLADRAGAYGSVFRVALKFFSPVSYATAIDYQEEMARLSRVAMRVAKIQQDHLMDVLNVLTAGNIHAMVTEWIDGYDLDSLLDPKSLAAIRLQVDADRWNYLNDVVLTQTEHHCRLKPGLAIAILRECLAGLASLHRQGIVHADLKPSNIMIKRTGNAKVIDFGSAFHLQDLPKRQTWTPRYAATELLEGASHSVSSDLASLGYVLVEMLSGHPPFQGITDIDALIRAKYDLPDRLPEIFPPDIVQNEILLHLIRGMIDPQPARRFPSAEAADLLDRGAADFQRQLIRGNLSSEYEHEMRSWLDDVSRSQGNRKP